MQDNQMEKDLTRQDKPENALTEPNRTEPNRDCRYWLAKSEEECSRQSEGIERQGRLSGTKSDRLQRPSESPKKVSKKVIVLGGIGKSARQNRDSMRVIGSKGCIYTIPAHADKEQPLVVKRWRRN